MKKEEYKLWLEKAIDDLKWTQANIQGKIFYGACFTAQQAAEKALKAYIIYKTGKFGKIHDLVKLIDNCAVYDKDFIVYRQKIAKLSFYYVQSRYPDITEIDIYNKEEAEEAYSLAEELISFIKEKILIL